MNAETIPSIACIGIIGKHDNPLSITLFPPHTSQSSHSEMELHLLSSLDIFDLRTRTATLTQDLGLLHPINETLAAYGWLTNTSMKFIIIVDMSGRDASTFTNGADPRVGAKPVYGLRDAELRPAFKAVHTAYIQLLQNPFYTPEDRTPLQVANGGYGMKGRADIKSEKFDREMRRIGNGWYPGIAAM